MQPWKPGVGVLRHQAESQDDSWMTGHHGALPVPVVFVMSWCGGMTRTVVETAMEDSPYVLEVWLWDLLNQL